MHTTRPHVSPHLSLRASTPVALQITVEGLPEAPEWPKWDAIRPLLTCQPGRPVTTQDIEGDVVALLSTGQCNAQPAQPAQGSQLWCGGHDT